MFFNLLLFAIIIIIYILLNYKKRNKISELFFLRVCFIIFFIFSAIRGFEIGTDTNMYINLFSSCASSGWSNFSWNSYFEPLYLVFNILLGFISNSNRFFIVITSFILNYSVYRFLKENSNNYFFSVLFYIGMLFFYTSMTMLRQFIAMAICLYGTKYAKQQKILPFTFCVLIAFGFHSSAFLALLYYPCYNTKYSKKYIGGIVISSIIIMLCLEPVVNGIMGFIGRQNYYTDRFGSDSISNFLYFVIYSIFLAFVLIEKKKNNEKVPDYYIYSILMAMCLNLIATNMNIIARGAEYFNIFSLIIIPNVLNYVKNSNNRFILKCSFFLFLILYSSTIIYLRPNWNSAYNYKTCFNSVNKC